MKIKLGLPKGSLQESTIQIFKKAGFDISLRQRSYFPTIDDPQIEPLLLRAQEIPKYVQQGVIDCGITGEDWIMESGSDVIRVCSLLYAKQGLNVVQWVMAVAQDSPIRKLKDLNGKRITTELVNVTREYLRKHDIDASVEFSWGATEAKIKAGLADAVVELTETGQSLAAHNLRQLDIVCASTTQLIANKKSMKDAPKRQKIENIALLLKGALSATGIVGLKMNVSRKNLDKVITLLPAMRKPTISGLSQRGWYAIETVTNEKKVRDLIPRLKKAGAEGIVEYPLNKVIY
jgi:ATP phosphoribosyltransferase